MPPKQKTVEIDEFPSQRICAADEVHERLLRTVPGYMETRNEIENRNLRVLEYGGATLRTGCTEIPVVVHVVHRNATENISDAQINSQIEILNADFRATNPDKASTPAAFAPLIGDARITFKLATLDPAGNPTTGITRTSSTNTSFNSDTDNVKHSSTGGEDAWPADRYLNIWTCGNLRTSSGQALLGYAQFPGGPADTDGVVILHSAFGNTGTATAPFDLGRTTTHEIGHWLDLRHIWGDDGTGCSGSDLVADTPNQGGPNFGAPTFPHVSCSNGPDGDMFMNYMDYVDDAAMVMFTAGQVTRMQTALDGPRSTIGTTSPCGKTIFKDGPKDPFKESIKDAPKDPIKEGPKDGVKDLPKDGAKDFVKDHPKEFAKDPLKDSIKEGPKDPIKDGVKDGGKDVVKDKPKESIKEFIKDFPDDLPKQLKDPQKNFVADTFPGPGPVIFPQVMGAQPFVIGGAGAGGAQGRGSDTDELLAAILQQLAQMNALLMQLLQR